MRNYAKFGVIIVGFGVLGLLFALLIIELFRMGAL